LLACSVALAQGRAEEPIATDRPDFTETAESVPLGRIQLEVGYTFARLSDERAHTLGEFLLRIATGRRTEARIGINSYSWVRSSSGRMSGLEDSTLGFKLELADGAETPGFGRPAVALIGQTTIPTGAPGFRENSLQPEAKLCLAWDLCENLSLGSNLNYGWPSEGGSRFGQFSGTLAFGYSLNARMGAFIEYFTFAPASQGGPNSSYVDGGFTYLVNDDFQLDFRAGLGLNSSSPEYFIGAGFGIRW
jgi:hypothetical protein